MWTSILAWDPWPVAENPRNHWDCARQAGRSSMVSLGYVGGPRRRAAFQSKARHASETWPACVALGALIVDKVNFIILYLRLACDFEILSICRRRGEC